MRLSLPIRLVSRRLSFPMRTRAAWICLSIALASATARTTLLHGQTPITVVALRTLDFGAVLPGLFKPVDAAMPSGGVLEFRGDRGKQIRITLALPTVILTTGGVFMPVTYSTSDALLAATFDPSGGTRFDPNVQKLGCLDPTTGSLFLFLGGLVQPRATQRRGAYAGTVVATVTYTGASCP